MPSIMGAAILGSAAIGGITSGIGASQQAGAAKDAAQLQYQASQQAAAQQWAMFQQIQGNLAPYMMTGQNAMNNLSMLTGNSPMISPEVAQWQQQLKAAQSALAGLGQAAPYGGASGTPGSTGSMTPGMQAVAAYNPQSEHSSGGLADLAMGWGGGGNMLESFLGANNRSAIGDIWGALQEGKPISDASWAEAGFGPGGAALPGAAGLQGPAVPPTALGTVGATGAAGGVGGPAVAAGATTTVAPGAMPTDAAGLQKLITDLQGKINQAQYSATPGNPLTAPLTRPFMPTMAELEATPGYQFTLQQGLRAAQNSATAMGLGQSGPAIAGAADYAAGLASQTYQQQFNNYWANNQNLYNMIGGLASMGQNAAAGVGNAGIQTAGAMGNLLTGGAAALGAGQVGAANAWAGALNNIGGSASNAALMLAMHNNGLFGGAAIPAAGAALPAGNDASLGMVGSAYA